MYDLRDIGLGREQQDDIVERHWADEVQEEPGLQVVNGDLTWFQDDLVRKVVRYDA